MRKVVLMLCVSQHVVTGAVVKHPLVKQAGMIGDVTTLYLSVQPHQQSLRSKPRALFSFFAIKGATVDFLCWYFKNSRLTLGWKPMSTPHPSASPEYLNSWWRQFPQSLQLEFQEAKF